MSLRDRDWAITGVSLRSASIAHQMNPQGGLYTIAERAVDSTSLRLIGAVRTVLVASEEPEAVIAAVAAPDTRIIRLTITEKGYCRTARGHLDFDLAHASSVYFFIAQGMLRRREAGLPGVILLSCDNLPENGATSGAGVLAS